MWNKERVFRTIMRVDTISILGSIACLILNVTADRVVMTNNGPMQGITVDSVGIKIEAFLGIPYAEPPIGRLRFQKPVPRTPWSGVYDASSLPPPCSQTGNSENYYEPNLANMTEDCLFLNLWVPYSKTTTHLKPVLIYQHGGSFNRGASNLKVFDGTALAKRGDIIVVTINYRVGVFGFFTSLTEDANGNFGLYDQVLAIKWVRDNIKSFGGDPSGITMMGNSAGAMGIAGHMVSPLTRNLFKRAILQSAAGIQAMILDENKRIMETSQRIATLVGCADKKLTLREYPEIVVKCMKRVGTKELVEAEDKISELNPLSFFPRVGDDYLPKPVIHLLKEGEFQDMEILVGNNQEEGNILLTVAIPQYFGVYGVNNVQTISKRLAKQLIRVIFENTEQTNEKEIADFYSESMQNMTSDERSRIIGQALGDYFFNCNIFFTAEIHSLRNPVYFYILSHRPSSTVLAEWMGVTHFDEVQYTFGNPLFGNFTEEELEMTHRIMDRWIAFTKTGNPNIPNEIQWPKFTRSNPQYLELDIKETVKERPDNYRCEFWRDRFQTVFDDSVVTKVVQSRITSASTMAHVCVSVIFLSTIAQWIYLRY